MRIYEQKKGKAMTKIFWAADSTVQYNGILTYPQTGIGQVFHLFLKPEVQVVNHAKNGRSTKSFLEEGRFEPMKEAMQEGDFLFVQFGHNDEKIVDPARYTRPFAEYAMNLEIFVNAAKEKGAHPVLITPLERRTFDENGVLAESEHKEYAQSMKETAKRLGVPCIDLTAMSRECLQKAGIEVTKNWYMHLPKDIYPYHLEGLTDNTHLKYAGAVVFGGCIAKGLQELGGIYADLLLDWREQEKLLGEACAER